MTSKSRHSFKSPHLSGVSDDHIRHELHRRFPKAALGAYHGNSKVSGIKLMCPGSRGETREVKKCSDSTCPLWRFRPYK